jgi:hypothetical protein
VVAAPQSRRAGRRNAVLALATVLLGPACRGQEDPAARASLEEATVTAEIRSRLLMVDGLAKLPLAVETRDGTATIKGTVADTLQPAAIRSIAERVRGVQRVNLELRVVPPSDSTAAPSDAGRAAGGAPPGAADRASPAGGDTRRPATPPDTLPSLDEAG